jgi:hypothetical protein
MQGIHVRKNFSVVTRRPVAALAAALGVGGAMLMAIPVAQPPRLASMRLR